MILSIVFGTASVNVRYLLIIGFTYISKVQYVVFTMKKLDIISLVVYFMLLNKIRSNGIN